MLQWNNICFHSDSGEALLQNLSGCAYPGEVLAILGPSGCGKTLLLNCLSGRLESSSGNVTVASKSIPPTERKYVITMCPQQEYLLGSLTVERVIKCGAKLVTPDSKEATRRTEDVITAMGLNSVRKTIVGTPIIRGCSGGERRRVAIAKELVAQKPILLVDAPTKGLDSAAAFQVVSHLKKLAQRDNITIVCSLDQPPSTTFQLVDKVYLMSYGQPVYNGSLRGLGGFMTNLGHPPPEHGNIADHCLSVVNGDFYSDADYGRTHIQKIIDKAATLGSLQREESTLTAQQVYASSSTEVIDKLLKTKKPTSFVKQTWTLTQRGMLNAFYNPILYWVRVAMYMAMGILMGFVWFQVGHSTAAVQFRLNGFYYAIAFLCFMMVAGIPGLLEERAVFNLEHSSGLYSAGAYVLALTVTSLPFILLMAIIYTVIAYYLIGLQGGADHFFLFLIILYASLLVADSIVLLVTAIIPIFVAALTIVAFMNGFFMVMEGYFVTKDDIPGFWIWGHYWSYQKYAFEAVAKNDFDGQIFDCVDTAVCGCSCPYIDDLSSSCQFRGVSVLASFGYEDVKIWLWIVVLIIMVVIYRILMVLWLAYGPSLVRKLCKPCKRRKAKKQAQIHTNNQSIEVGPTNDNGPPTTIDSPSEHLRGPPPSAAGTPVDMGFHFELDEPQLGTLNCDDVFVHHPKGPTLNPPSMYEHHPIQVTTTKEEEFAPRLPLPETTNFELADDPEPQPPPHGYEYNAFVDVDTVNPDKKVLYGQQQTGFYGHAYELGRHPNTQQNEQTGLNFVHDEMVT